MRWDFDGAWEAIVFEGAKRGKVFKTSVSALIEDKWLAIGASAGHGTNFGHASSAQKKEASYLFLEKHMKDAMAADGQSPVV